MDYPRQLPAVITRLRKSTDLWSREAFDRNGPTPTAHFRITPKRPGDFTALHSCRTIHPDWRCLPRKVGKNLPLECLPWIQIAYRVDKTLVEIDTSMLLA